MEIKVDTSDISGKLLTGFSPKELKYQTNVLSYDSEEFEQLIREIMQANLILPNQ